MKYERRQYLLRPFMYDRQHLPQRSQGGQTILLVSASTFHCNGFKFHWISGFWMCFWMCVNGFKFHWVYGFWMWTGYVMLDILQAIYFQFSAWPVVFSTCGDSTCALQVHLVLLVLVFDWNLSVKRFMIG